MRYFFELLDAFRSLGSNLSRIDENQNNDPRLQNVAELISIASDTAPGQQIPAGNAGLIIPVTVQAPSAAKQKQGVIFNLNFEGAMYPVGFTAQGIASQDIAPGVMTQLFGPGPGEEKKKKGKKEPKVTTPTLSPEELQKIRDAQAREATYVDVEESINNLLDEVAEDPEAKCHFDIRYNNLAKALRPIGLKPTVESFSKTLGLQKPLKANTINILRRKFLEYYETKKDPCGFIKSITSNLENRPDILAAFVYQKGGVANARDQMLTNQAASIRTSIEASFDDSVGEFSAKLIKGECKPNESCVEDRDLTDDDKLAFAENIDIFLRLAQKEKLTEDEKILMSHLVKYTDTDQIAIAGVTLDSSLVVRDRGRAYYDLVQFIAKKHNLDIRTIKVKNLGLEGGNVNQAIGTFFERITVALTLSLKGAKDVAAKYLSQIADVCAVLKAIDTRIKQADRKPGGMSLESYKSRMEVLNNQMTCGEFADVAEKLQVATQALVERANPAGIVHTGLETGKGTRPDIKFFYDSREAAIAGGRAIGMGSDETVQEMTMEELLATSPKYRELVENLTGPGQLYDLTKKVYVVPVGLKTGTAAAANARINVGTATFNSISEYVKDIISRRGSDKQWVSNVLKHLGVNSSPAAVASVARKMEEELISKVEAVDSVLDSALTKVNVNGKSENTAKLIADSIAEKLKKELNFDELASDEAYKIAKDFAKEAAKSNPDPKKLKKYKNALRGRLKLKVLSNQLDSMIQSDDETSRLAAATFLGMTGGVNRDQPLFCYDIPGQRLKMSDHNEVAVKPLRALLGDENFRDYVYNITDKGTVSIIDGNGVTVLSIGQETSNAGSLTGGTSISDVNLRPVGRGMISSSRNPGNQEVLTEVVKMLRAQLVYFSKLFK